MLKNSSGLKRSSAGNLKGAVHSLQRDSGFPTMTMSGDGTVSCSIMRRQPAFWTGLMEFSPLFISRFVKPHDQTNASHKTPPAACVWMLDPYRLNLLSFYPGDDSFGVALPDWEGAEDYFAGDILQRKAPSRIPSGDRPAARFPATLFPAQSLHRLWNASSFQPRASSCTAAWRTSSFSSEEAWALSHMRVPAHSAKSAPPC